MKISFLIDSISGMGGTERVTSTLANAFSLYGYEVKIYTLEDENENEGIFYPLADNIRVYYETGNKFIRLFRFLRLIKKNAESCIVISMGRLSFETACINLLLKNKLIIAEHGSFSSLNKAVRVIKSFSFFISHKVVLLTRYDHQFIKDEFPYIKNTYIVKNPNPFWSELPKYNKSFNERGNNAIAIGRFCSVKNFEALIDIWNQADTKDWVLNIIGGGELDNRIRQMAKQSSKKINVIEPTNELGEIYNNSKLYLMTSFNEGLPMVLIESQSFGIPAISYDCDSGPREVIRHNETGYLIEVDNDHEFIHKINEFISSPNIAKLLSDNSLKCSREYSPEQIINQWVKII